jgi:hypothetical protein
MMRGHRLVDVHAPDIPGVASFCPVSLASDVTVITGPGKFQTGRKAFFLERKKQRTFVSLALATTHRIWCIVLLWQPKLRR